MDPSKNNPRFLFDPKQFQAFVAPPINNNHPQTHPLRPPIHSTNCYVAQGAVRQNLPLVLENENDNRNPDQLSGASIPSQPSGAFMNSAPTLTSITSKVEEEILKLLPNLNDDQLSNALKYNFIRWTVNGWQLTYPTLEKIHNGSLTLNFFISKIGLPQNNNHTTNSATTQTFKFFDRNFIEEKNLRAASDNGYLIREDDKWKLSPDIIRELESGDIPTIIDVYATLLGLDMNDPKRAEAYTAVRHGGTIEVIIKILER